jgi:class 3 adenylate cyclase
MRAPPYARRCATKIEGGGATRWAYTATGPITNIAARIGALGEPIAISAETRRRLGSAFEVASLGPQVLKNVAEPIEPFRVIGAIEGTTGGPSGGDQPVQTQ